MHRCAANHGEDRLVSSAERRIPRQADVPCNRKQPSAAEWNPSEHLRTGSALLKVGVYCVICRCIRSNLTFVPASKTGLVRRATAKGIGGNRERRGGDEGNRHTPEVAPLGACMKCADELSNSARLVRHLSLSLPLCTVPRSHI
jgi:hypothetical protein